MEIEMIRIVGSLAISVLFLAPVILSEYSRKKKDKEMTEKEPQQTEAEPGDPKVAMLRNATRQSMDLNLSAMDSFQRMSEVAGQYREDTTTKHHPQNDPWYQHTEWMENEENWS